MFSSVNIAIFNDLSLDFAFIAIKNNNFITLISWENYFMREYIFTFKNRIYKIYSIFHYSPRFSQGKKILPALGEFTIYILIIIV